MTKISYQKAGGTERHLVMGSARDVAKLIASNTGATAILNQFREWEITDLQTRKVHTIVYAA